MVTCDKCGHKYLESDARTNSVSQCPRCCDEYLKFLKANSAFRFYLPRKVAALVTANKRKIVISLVALFVLGGVGYYFSKPAVTRYLKEREHDRLHNESLRESKLMLARRAAQGHKELNIGCAQILGTARLYAIAKKQGVPLSEALSLFEYHPTFDADQKAFLRPYITVAYVHDFSIEQSISFALASCKVMNE